MLCDDNLKLGTKMMKLLLLSLVLLLFLSNKDVVVVDGEITAEATNDESSQVSYSSSSSKTQHQPKIFSLQSTETKSIHNQEEESSSSSTTTKRIVSTNPFLTSQQNNQQLPTLFQRFHPSTTSSLLLSSSLMRLGNNDDDSDNDDTSTCHAGALCVGPGRLYPLGRQVNDVQLYSQFIVPSLPQKFNTKTMTYYDYLNMFWRDLPNGGYMNQFVPQLMLGNSLANSSNYPNYIPQWIELPTWHIGAQDFMGLCAQTTAPGAGAGGGEEGYICNKDSWIPKAATGKLIPVEPGEIIETTIQLRRTQKEEEEEENEDDENDVEWVLQIGVVDGGPSRSSIVIVRHPFMGLLPINSTLSWMEDIYENIYIGSCLENYGMKHSENYPSTWEIQIDIWADKTNTNTNTNTNTTTTTINDDDNDINKVEHMDNTSDGIDRDGDREDNNQEDEEEDHYIKKKKKKKDYPFWKDWRLEHTRSCHWQPKSSIITVDVSNHQRTKWNATLETSKTFTTSKSATTILGTVKT